jgi:hypothetical protein
VSQSPRKLKDQKFHTFEQWVRRASNVLTNHPLYNNTEHCNKKPWRGMHFVATCYDMDGRIYRNGADMQRARDEQSFPVYWIWPDQYEEAVFFYLMKEAGTGVT